MDRFFNFKKVIIFDKCYLAGRHLSKEASPTFDMLRIIRNHCFEISFYKAKKNL